MNPVKVSKNRSKEDQERDDSLLREYDDDDQTIFDRIKKFYPDDQDKKSTGFVLRKCASVIAVDNRPFEHWWNHFLFVPIIFLPLMILAYVFCLASIRSITGPAFFLALVCLIIFTLVAGVLMGFWYSFWAVAGPFGSLVFYVSALGGLTPRALMLAGDLPEPQGLFLRAATDAISICCFVSIFVVLANRAYDWGMATVKARARWKRPVPHLLWALFKALEELAGPTDSWLDPSIEYRPVVQLEIAARCLEFLQKRFADSGVASVFDVRQYYLRRAAGLRKLKMRAILPTPKNLEYLQKEIRRVLDLAAAGEWDEMPKADLPTIAPLPWQKRAINIVRSLAIALLPALIVTALDVNQRLPRQFSSYIVLIAWGWAIVSFLSMLDPRFGQKLAAFKDLPNLSPFGSKSKEDKL
jgi:hypothetical protein